MTIPRIRPNNGLPLKCLNERWSARVCSRVSSFRVVQAEPAKTAWRGMFVFDRVRACERERSADWASFEFETNF